MAVAAIVVGAAAGLAANWPGHLSYDSVVQLAEGRAGVYGGAHPPVMSWLLGIADAAWPGAALFVVFDTALIAGALVSLVALGRRVGWPTALLAVAVALLPQTLIYPSIVWKDVLFAGSATAGFACLAHAAAGWAHVERRFALPAAALLLLTLAALARQNGAVVLPFAAAAVGWIAARQGGPGRVRRGLLHALAFLGVAALVAAGAAAALNARHEPGSSSSSSGQWQVLQAYDLVNALSLAPRTGLPVLRSKAPWLETLVRTEGVAAYSPIRADTLAPVLDKAARRGGASGLIAAQWEDLILRDPLLYLRARKRTFEWVLLTPDSERCGLIYTGVDGPAEEMAGAGLLPRRDTRDEALAVYALSLAATPVYWHGAYGGLGLALLALLLRRRRGPDIAVAAMLAAAFAFAASFAVISIACDYRYLYDLDLAVIAAALYTAATWKGDQLCAPTADEPPSD